MKVISKEKTMKAAEILLRYMDEVQRFARMINSYIDMGIDFLMKLKKYVDMAIQYLEQAVDALVKYLGGRKTDQKHMSDDYMFV